METTEKCKSNKTYEVQLKVQEQPLVTIAILEDLDSSISLALSLHKASNVVHQIFVVSSDQVHIVLNSY